MKKSVSLPVAATAAALTTASFFPISGAAMPMAPLAGAPGDGPIQVNGVRHHHYRGRLRLPPIEVYPGLYYGCRPGWYCFGPPLRPYFARGWYGGFNSIYGYQGARWRPPSRETRS